MAAMRVLHQLRQPFAFAVQVAQQVADDAHLLLHLAAYPFGLSGLDAHHSEGR